MYNLYVHERENSDFQTFDALYTLLTGRKKSIARETYEIIRMRPEVAWPYSYLGVDDFQNIETYAV